MAVYGKIGTVYQMIGDAAPDSDEWGEMEEARPGDDYIAQEDGAWAASEDLQAEAIRTERDRRIEAFMWRVQRYESETRQGVTTTDDITALDTYIQALRGLPEEDGFPWNGDVGAAPWPDEPGAANS